MMFSKYPRGTLLKITSGESKGETGEVSAYYQASDEYLLRIYKKDAKPEYKRVKAAYLEKVK